MNSEQVQAVKDIVETWNMKKVTGRDFNRRDMYYFVEMMNYHTRQLVSVFKVKSADYWQLLALMTEQCAKLTGSTPTEVGLMFLPSELATLVSARHARDFIVLFQVFDPWFWEGLSELAVHAVTVTTKGAKIIADGIDRTNV